MKVRIISCNKKYSWYYYKIGNIYDVETDKKYPLHGDYYKVLNSKERYPQYIYKQDCENISVYRNVLIEELLNEG